MSISEFWDCTPRELSFYFKGKTKQYATENENLIAQAWLTAYFYRVEKMPPLTEFIKPKPQTEEEMLKNMLNALGE
jgi:hypothetical protein